MPTTRRPEPRARSMQDRPAYPPPSARRPARAAPAFRVPVAPYVRVSGSPAGALVRDQQAVRPTRPGHGASAYVAPLRQQIMRDAPRTAPVPGHAKALWQRVLAALRPRTAPAPTAVARVPRLTARQLQPAARATPAPALEGARLLQLVALPSTRLGLSETVGVHVVLGACHLRVDEDGDAVDVGGIDARRLLGHTPAGSSLLGQLCALPGGSHVPWGELAYLGVRASALTRATCPISLHDIDEMRLPVAVRCEQVWRLFDLPALCTYLEQERAVGRTPANPLNRRSFELLRDVRCVVRLDD